MSELRVASPAPPRSGHGLLDARQLSVPAMTALLVAIALVLGFDRFWTPAEVPGALDRYLANSFNRLIAGLFIASVVYALLQAVGLALDNRAVQRLREPDPASGLGQRLLTFVTGRAGNAHEVGLLGASRRWYRTVDRAEDFLILSDHLLVVRERQYALNLGPIQYAAWAMPLLGFIGTVIGITRSIGGLQVVVADVSAAGSGLESVIGGLQFAFDTTLVGLLLVLPTMAMLIPLRARGEDVCMQFHEALLDDYYSHGSGAARRDR